LSTLWTIRCFGGLRAEQEGQCIDHFRTQKTGALLAYLAYYGDRSHPRELLTELFWPECSPEAGRASLSTALSALRRELEPPGAGVVLLADRAAVRLNPATIVVDVAQFETALRAVPRTASREERAQTLAAAVDLHRGEFLPGYFEDWVLRERQWLQGRYFEALGQLLVLLTELNDLPRALQYAQEGVRVDPLREETHRDLMRLYLAAEQPAEALRQYEELKRLLSQQLDAMPDIATELVAREIECRLAPTREPDAAPEKSAEPSGYLPRLSLLHPLTGPAGGAVPLNSPYYVIRPVDALFRSAVTQGDSIILVKGARQMGKTSLLARGLQQAREAGARVIRTDFQLLDMADLQSAERLLRVLAEWIADQLDLEVLPEQSWKPHLGASVNLTRYLRREALPAAAAPVVWGLDEVDRLFSCDFRSQLFGMFRAWHNDRVLDPSGPWSRLTLAIAYATEHHLFISDLNQSPFNVGTRLVLDDFTLEQVADLNRRFGSPLSDEAEIARLMRLLGGHPYLVHSALDQMTAHRIGLATLEAQADRNDGLFGDHLRRLLVSLSRDPELCEVVRVVLRGRPCTSEESFYRLRSAGVIAGDSARDARPRCQLYANYLGRYL
jgi:DNA-binding SARP family transcriptional activator